MRRQGIHYIVSLNALTPEKMTKLHLYKGVKNNPRIISKSHAHIQTMTKTFIKYIVTIRSASIFMASENNSLLIK